MDTATICLVSRRAHASLPINVDLEMTFPVRNGVQSYQPNFQLPSEGCVLPSSAEQQAAAGTHSVITLFLHQLRAVYADVILVKPVANAHQTIA